MGEAGPIIALSFVLAGGRAPLQALIMAAFAVGSAGAMILAARASGGAYARIVARTMGTSGQLPMAGIRRYLAIADAGRGRFLDGVLGSGGGNLQNRSWIDRARRPMAIILWGGGAMTMRARAVRFRSMLRARSSLVVLVLLTLSGNAWGRPMHVVSSTPTAEAVMHGRNMQYVVRFDGPVDHVWSRLEVVRGGQVVETLHPLLDSAADVLFASAPAPAAGSYALHWTVKSMTDGDTSDGMIPFSVAP